MKIFYDNSRNHYFHENLFSEQILKRHSAKFENVIMCLPLENHSALLFFLNQKVFRNFPYFIASLIFYNQSMKNNISIHV